MSIQSVLIFHPAERILKQLDEEQQSRKNTEQRLKEREGQCQYKDRNNVVVSTSPSEKGVASYADALWARHAIFPCGEGVRDEPKECLRRRLKRG